MSYVNPEQMPDDWHPRPPPPRHKPMLDLHTLKHIGKEFRRGYYDAIPHEPLPANLQALVDKLPATEC